MSTKIKALPVTVLFGVIKNIYSPVTSAGFTVYQLIVSNFTNQDIFISFDGVNDAIFIPAKTAGIPIVPTQIFPFDRNIAFVSTFYLRGIAAPGSGKVVIQYIGCDKSAFSDDAA